MLSAVSLQQSEWDAGSCAVSGPRTWQIWTTSLLPLHWSQGFRTGEGCAVNRPWTVSFGQPINDCQGLCAHGDRGFLGTFKNSKCASQCYRDSTQTCPRFIDICKVLLCQEPGFHLTCAQAM